jgi:hypothetical protein
VRFLLAVLAAGFLSRKLKLDLNLSVKSLQKNSNDGKTLLLNRLLRRWVRCWRIKELAPIRGEQRNICLLLEPVV